MRIHRSHVGTTTGHAAEPPAEVSAFRLSTGDGFAVTVWTYGATLTEVSVPDRDGRLANVTTRLTRLRDYEDTKRNGYVGSVLGRYCRCVAGGRFRLDGAEHVLDRNAGSHHLHGGSLGFDKFVWEADAGQDGAAAVVTMRLCRPGGDQGYPGEVSAEVTYSAYPEGRLAIDFAATTTAPTIIGLTSHAFWNLSGGGTVDGHRLAVNASRYLPADLYFIPLPGPPAMVAGTPVDYRAPRMIGPDRLDDFFALDDGDWAAELTDEMSGRALRIASSQPGLGVYSGDGLPRPRAGLCLQASAWPDAPNRPDYPSCRLDPGQLYRERTWCEFTRC
jgi:aldose 1-epimerase